MNANAEKQRRKRRFDYAKLAKTISLVLASVVGGVGGGHYINQSQMQKIRNDVNDNDKSQKEHINRLNSHIQYTNAKLDTLEKWMQSLNVSMDNRIDAHLKQVERVVLNRVKTLQGTVNRLRETSADHVRTLDLVQLSRTLEDFKSETVMRVKVLTNSVTDMKGQIEITSGEFEKQVEELEAVKIDSDELRELITTNHQRTRHKFRLVKSKWPQQVGPVGVPVRVKVRGTSPNRNRYSIKLLTNGKEIARRRMTLFEPVQFYVGASSIPFEFVVNKIEKGVIEGHLSTPIEPVVKVH